MINLNTIFGPSKAKVWKNFAEELGGHVRFEKKDFFSNSKLFITYKSWEMLMDVRTTRNKNSSSKYTQIKIPYSTSSDFHFEISHEGLFSSIGKHLNFNDIEVYDPKFDKEFYLKANNETLLKSILADERIRKIMLQLKEVELKTKMDDGFWGTNLPNGVKILQYECYGVLKSIDEFDKLIELLSRFLDRMVDVGAANSFNPNIKLQ